MESDTHLPYKKNSIYCDVQTKAQQKIDESLICV